MAGRDAALSLALAFGGEDLYICTRGAQARRLEAVVGARPWEAIVARFGGETVGVPLARRVLVRHLADRGLDTAQRYCQVVRLT